MWELRTKMGKQSLEQGCLGSRVKEAWMLKSLLSACRNGWVSFQPAESRRPTTRHLVLALPLFYPPFTLPSAFLSRCNPRIPLSPLGLSLDTWSLWGLSPPQAQACPLGTLSLRLPFFLGLSDPNPPVLPQVCVSPAE